MLKSIWSVGMLVFVLLALPLYGCTQKEKEVPAVEQTEEKMKTQESTVPDTSKQITTPPDTLKTDIPS